MVAFFINVIGRDDNMMIAADDFELGTFDYTFTLNGTTIFYISRHLVRDIYVLDDSSPVFSRRYLIKDTVKVGDIFDN